MEAACAATPMAASNAPAISGKVISPSCATSPFQKRLRTSTMSPPSPKRASSSLNLYRIEPQIEGLSADERRAIRREKTLPRTAMADLKPCAGLR
jgi:hypothetical protein